MNEAKEKAKKLVDKYYYIQGLHGIFMMRYYQAKECAKMEVKSIIDLLEHDLGHDATAQGLLIEYKEIEKEIELL